MASIEVSSLRSCAALRHTESLTEGNRPADLPTLGVINVDLPKGAFHLLVFGPPTDGLNSHRLCDAVDGSHHLNNALMSVLTLDVTKRP